MISGRLIFKLPVEAYQGRLTAARIESALAALRVMQLALQLRGCASPRLTQGLIVYISLIAASCRCLDLQSRLFA
jgi:hypothetical protein